MPAQVIAFDDAVKVGIVGLSAGLTARGRPLPVVSKVPKPRPEQFVRLERVGGVRRGTVTDQSWLDVHSWAATDEDAMTLAILVRAIFGAMRGRYGGATIHNTGEVAGLHPMTDPATGQPYVAFTGWLDLRGRTI